MYVRTHTHTSEPSRGPGTASIAILTLSLNYHRDTWSDHYIVPDVVVPDDDDSYRLPLAVNEHVYWVLPVTSRSSRPTQQ